MVPCSMLTLIYVPRTSFVSSAARKCLAVMGKIWYTMLQKKIGHGVEREDQLKRCGLVVACARVQLLENTQLNSTSNDAGWEIPNSHSEGDCS